MPSYHSTPDSSRSIKVFPPTSMCFHTFRAGWKLPDKYLLTCSTWRELRCLLGILVFNQEENN